MHVNETYLIIIDQTSHYATKISAPKLLVISIHPLPPPGCLCSSPLHIIANTSIPYVDVLYGRTFDTAARCIHAQRRCSGLFASAPAMNDGQMLDLNRPLSGSSLESWVAIVETRCSLSWSSSESASKPEFSGSGSVSENSLGWWWWRLGSTLIAYRQMAA